MLGRNTLCGGGLFESGAVLDVVGCVRRRASGVTSGSGVVRSMSGSWREFVVRDNPKVLPCETRW